MKDIQEYIWLGGNGEFRSKVKVSEVGYPITDWNYDGSSTGQASDSGNTEINLRPIYHCINPFATPNTKINSTLVLCETYNSNEDHITDRQKALHIFNQKPSEIPWFGLEQEYFFQPHQQIYFLKNMRNRVDFIVVSVCLQSSVKLWKNIWRHV